MTGLALTEPVISPPDDEMQTESLPVLVIGGGPAGLTAAYELLRLSPGIAPVVLEAGPRVGGIARTEEYKGYRFDIGGHRFFTKVTEVANLWREVMGDDFITVPRLSRIYYRGKFYDYPLRIWNALSNLGLFETFRILVSYLRWKTWPQRPEETFEQWVTNRFGRRLFNIFFRTYTEKVWGVPCSTIRADWAAQRIKNLSLGKAAWNALTGANSTASLIHEFQYPPLGPGQMWERFRDRIIERGGQVQMRTRATRLCHADNCITSVEYVLEGLDTPRCVQPRHVITSMPIVELIARLDPPPPEHVLKAAQSLKYRDFLIVTLILDRPEPFHDNWIYIHSPDVHVGRIQNFGAWSRQMLADQSKSSIGMEYFCQAGDGLWTMTNEELVALATRELAQLGLAKETDVIDGTVIRQPKAYPVYDAEYREHLDTIRTWLSTIKNLQTIGRNGMHRYNNQDHSMLTAILAAQNVLGASHDLWDVNTERSYHEEFVTKEQAGKAEPRLAELSTAP